MKRYRILFGDFDTRANILRLAREESNKKALESAVIGIRQGLINAYGILDAESKLKNFEELGAKPFSIIAFHNNFFAQIRSSYIIGNYYPALIAACALGERILNQLILGLREDFRSSEHYKKIYRKDSFDDWELMISILQDWEVLLPEVASEFRFLMDRRHRAIHFNPETDRDSKNLSLSAILSLQKIIAQQFSAFGSQPWFITSIPGEIYLKRDWESNPFIKLVYLLNATQVGYQNQVVGNFPEWKVDDQGTYDEIEISDEKFSELRRNYQSKS